MLGLHAQTIAHILNLIIDTHSACLVYAFLLNLVKSYFLSNSHKRVIRLDPFGSLRIPLSGFCLWLLSLSAKSRSFPVGPPFGINLCVQICVILQCQRQ